ncbi:keratinocyte proline-rich protein-like [Danaus plexippus]|uniref:keratinocyte proline-rich protein-like n=1 Tax=Danaus plexippus TaxID=13037 RepID=UPI002AB01167|nr:keratinocyte proline-rich protein-like [Danaus plexippus]
MKSSKVKNPCKICCETVSKKNGLQCQGACRKWAHYKCLNYSPGKVQDIKLGIIKIACPCPDCITPLPKECIQVPPEPCEKTQCPVNKVPRCISAECPKNVEKPIPCYPEPAAKCNPSPSFDHCKLPQCPQPKPTTNNNVTSPNRDPSPPRRTSPPKDIIKKKVSPLCPTSPEALKNPCPTVSPTKCPSKQKLCKPCPIRSISCSDMSQESSFAKPFEKIKRITSDIQMLGNLERRSIFSCIENLCSTVGQLSNQVKELVCKMKVSN